MEDGAVVLVAKGHMVQLQGGILPCFLCAVGRLVRRQQTEDLLRRGCSVHRDVEVAAQQAERQEEICRQQKDGQRRCQGDLPFGKRRHRTDDAQPRAAIGHQVHEGHGVQLHGQHFHRDLPEALGLPVHLLMLPAVGLVDLQGGQALDIFQKAVAEGGVFAPVFVQQLFGEFLHRHDGHGDQRHTAQQDDGRPRMDAHQQHKEGDRGQQAVEQLRQILCKVGVDLLHALTGQHDGLTGGDGLAVTRAQACEFFVNLAAQGALDILGGAVAHAGCQQGEDIPQRNGEQAEHKVLPQHLVGQPARKDGSHQLGNDPHKDDVAEHPQPLERHVRAHKAHGTPVKGDQLFVDHDTASVSSLASGPNMRSYAPVKARSGSAEVRASAAVQRSSSVRSIFTGGKFASTVSSCSFTALATKMPRSVR